MENNQSCGSAATLTSPSGRSNLVEITNRPRTNEVSDTVDRGKIISTSTQSEDQGTPPELIASCLPAAQEYSPAATVSPAASSHDAGATNFGDGNHCVPLSQPIIRRHLDGTQSDANARRSVPWTSVARYHHPTNGHGLWSYETGGARRTRAMSIGGGRPTSLPASQVEVYVEVWEEEK